jgi:hypothetical protein
MRKALTLLFLATSISLYGQNPQIIVPGYFIGGKDLSKIDSFTNYLLSKLPEYHLVSMDSSRQLKQEFTFRNNEKEVFYIRYEIAVVSGNSDLKIPYKYAVSDIWITGQFLTLTKLYNAIFNKSAAPEEIQKAGYVNGIINTESAKYFFVMDHGTGWGMRFLKKS